MPIFKLISKFKPTGDQPHAIENLTKNLKAGAKHQVLLGVTGSGKTYTMASVIEKIQEPVLVISPNKTLCAQLYQEFKEFFPKNGVHYFVSYYDYYQPEAYIPQTDTYIEKDAKINEEIDRLRHAAVQDVSSRKDVIVIASVSCIYNIGSPEYYQNVSLEIKQGQKIKRRDLIAHLTSLQYQRNDINFKPGTFRVRGEVVEIYLVTGKEIIRVEFTADKIEQITKLKTNGKSVEMSNVTGQMPAPHHPSPAPEQVRCGMDSARIGAGSNVKLFPAHFWTTPQDKLNIAIENIKLELQERLKELKKQKPSTELRSGAGLVPHRVAEGDSGAGKLLEAQRLEQRTNYDLEMLKETGYCHGIENYSRHLEFRKPGEPPFSLVDYFNKNFLIFIDESHQTLPQLRAMANQDRVRKETLIEYGFRLPSAIDNRPLTFEEFNQKINQVVYVSATPSDYEKKKSSQQYTPYRNKVSGAGYIVEQLIRPTGLLEPAVEVRPARNQVKDLIEEIKKRVEKKQSPVVKFRHTPKGLMKTSSKFSSRNSTTGQRVLVITLTKRLAEELSDYLSEQNIKTQYLHSEIKTLERPDILKKLRLGEYDVIVGINLLREGLDLPEVALVAILDADKEGFLRNETTLIQTMGRAARHLEGKAILYADKMTLSMKNAIKEVLRRRKIQQKFNTEHKITPKPIIKEIRDWQFSTKEKAVASELWVIRDLKLLEKEMKTAAKNLDFERAAEIRDLIKELKNSNIKS